MSNAGNNNGRAYEYACLHALHGEIERIRPATVLRDGCYEAVERAWRTLSAEERDTYMTSARSAVPTIFALEPNMVEADGGDLILYIQPDRNGEDADVRDIIIERKNIRWEIGLSLKHNHTAVKHSRLSPTIDFGRKWYGVPCSERYWQEVTPVFDYLRAQSEKSVMFCDLPDKFGSVYKPVMDAFSAEIARQTEMHSQIPRRMVEYLLSKYDFYKVISFDGMRLTVVQSFNIYGTLNRPSRTQRPSHEVPVLPLPTTLLHAGVKPGCDNTVVMCFDNGWQFSFRIHNAEKFATPSLKLDVRIEGMPSDANVKFNCRW